MAEDKQIVLRTPDDLKVFLGKNYMNQIKNFFSDEKQALKFLSSVMADVQKNPKLLECVPATLINSYMTMAQLGFMPSGVSGEAYVLPYKSRDGMIAQFQLGYQGLVTLFYKAGGQSIRAEIVRKNDSFSYENGQIKHSVDIFKSDKERGEPVAAYAIAMINGHEIAKAMNREDIIAMGRKFSKSFNTDFTPWKEGNDPELWMWKKTVLKQLGKLMPKNETINKAIAEDNKDSIIADRLESATHGTQGLTMGSLLTNGNKETKGTKEGKGKDAPAEAGQDETHDASEGVGAINLDGEKV